MERIANLFPIQHGPEPLQVLFLPPDAIPSRQPRVFVHRETKQWTKVGADLVEVRRGDFTFERFSVHVATVDSNRLSATV